MYDGDLIDATTIAPGVAMVGLMVGLDWIIVFTVCVILLAVVAYRRRAQRGPAD